MKIIELETGEYKLEVPSSMIWLKDPIARDQEIIVFIHPTLESAELQAKYYADYHHTNSPNINHILHRDI